MTRFPPWTRVLVVAAALVVIVVVAHLSGATERLSVAHVREEVAAAGAWGPLIFVGLFCVGELVHVPGMAFVTASVLAYGRGPGAALAFVGAVASLTVTFALVRVTSWRPLAAGTWKWRFVARTLAQLETHPVRTIVVLRLVFWMAPQLNYALALSNVRFAHYLVGSILGLLAPIAGGALVVGTFLAR